MPLGWFIALSIAGSAGATALVNGFISAWNTRRKLEWEERKWARERADKRDAINRREWRQMHMPLLMRLQHFLLHYRQWEVLSRGGYNLDPEQVVQLAADVEHGRLVARSPTFTNLLDQISALLSNPAPIPADLGERLKYFQGRTQLFESPLKEGISEFRSPPESAIVAPQTGWPFARLRLKSPRGQ